MQRTVDLLPTYHSKPGGAEASPRVRKPSAEQVSRVQGCRDNRWDRPAQHQAQRKGARPAHLFSVLTSPSAWGLAVSSLLPFPTPVLPSLAAVLLPQPCSSHPSTSPPCVFLSCDQPPSSPLLSWPSPTAALLGLWQLPLCSRFSGRGGRAGQLTAAPSLPSAPR